MKWGVAYGLVGGALLALLRYVEYQHFVRALGVGLLVTLLASGVYVVAWEVVYWSVLPDFAETYGDFVLDRMRVEGASEAARARGFLERRGCARYSPGVSTQSRDRSGVGRPGGGTLAEKGQKKAAGKSVGALIGEGLVGGVAKATGTYFMSRILSAAFGNASKGAPSDAELAEALVGLQTQLDDVEAEVEGVRGAIVDLERALQVDVEKINGFIQQAKISTAISTIQTHTETTPETGLAWFVVASERPKAKEVKAFAEDVLGSWDIPNQVQSIANGLLGGQVGNDVGLIASWTTLFIAEMGPDGDSPRLLDYYLALESYTWQQVLNQWLGVNLVANAYSYHDAVSEPSSKGLDYLTKTFGPRLRKILARYLFHVEKLVLSQWVARRALPRAPRLPEAAEAILTRANLFARLNLAAIELDASPRLEGVLFTRPSLLEQAGGSGPRLAPGGLAPQTGTLVETRTGVKTIDVDTSRMGPRGQPTSTLRPYADSDVRVVRYSWTVPEPSPEGGPAVDREPEREVALRAWDPRTLEPLEHPDASAFLYGFFVDQDALDVELDPKTTVALVHQHRVRHNPRQFDDDVRVNAEVGPTHPWVREATIVTPDWETDNLLAVSRGGVSDGFFLTELFAARESASRAVVVGVEGLVTIHREVKLGKGSLEANAWISIDALRRLDPPNLRDPRLAVTEKRRPFELIVDLEIGTDSDEIGILHSVIFNAQPQDMIMGVSCRGSVRFQDLVVRLAWPYEPLRS